MSEVILFKLDRANCSNMIIHFDVADIQNLSIDQQGQISQPTTALGTILSITSSDSDFSNDKFATESTATDRDLTIRISIPGATQTQQMLT